MGNVPSDFPVEGISRPPPYGKWVVLRKVEPRISMNTNTSLQASYKTTVSQNKLCGAFSKGSGSKGRIKFYWIHKIIFRIHLALFGYKEFFITSVINLSHHLSLHIENESHGWKQ